MPLSNKLSHRCGRKRQLSGIDRFCDQGYEHDGPHHATTMTGVDRWWFVGIPTEFVTVADAEHAVAERDADRTPPTGGGSGIERLRRVDAVTHQTQLQTIPPTPLGNPFPRYRALCSCGWKSWSYPHAGNAQSAAQYHREKNQENERG